MVVEHPARQGGAVKRLLRVFGRSISRKAISTALDETVDGAAV
jgi:hypothetical protein